MIERQHGQVALTCDGCPEQTDLVDNDDFDSLVAKARRDGWRIDRVDGEWCHYCSDCKAESALDKARRKFGK